MSELKQKEFGKEFPIEYEKNEMESYDEYFFEEDENFLKIKTWESIIIFFGFVSALALAIYMSKIFFTAYLNGGVIIVDVNKFHEGTFEFFLMIPTIVCMFTGFLYFSKKIFA